MPLQIEFDRHKGYVDLERHLVNVERISMPVSCSTGNFSSRELAEKRALEMLEDKGRSYEADYYELVALHTEFIPLWMNPSYRAQATGIFYRNNSD